MTQEQIEKYRMSLFVDYDLAVELKNKGFDMPCLGFYSRNRFCFNDEMDESSNQSDYSINSQLDSHFVAAPLIDQVIEWLIEHHNLNIEVSKSYSLYDYKLGVQYQVGFFKTRKEAQIAGIKHALTLVP